VSEFVSFLRQVCPDYDNLADILMTGPTIKPVLEKNNLNRWRITLQEVWPDGVDINDHTGSFELDNRVDWVTDELARWDDAKRTSWDTWVFKSKRSAEKFIMVYGLVWVK